jgi:hypothetical protein
MTFPSDLEIARGADLLPLAQVAAGMGIGRHLLEPYGEGVAKIKLDAIDELADRPKAKYVVVSAITPTPLGEGKTTPTVGLGQGLVAESPDGALRTNGGLYIHGAPIVASGEPAPISRAAARRHRTRISWRAPRRGRRRSRGREVSSRRGRAVRPPQTCAPGRQE